MADLNHRATPRLYWYVDGLLGLLVGSGGEAGVQVLLTVRMPAGASCSNRRMIKSLKSSSGEPGKPAGHAVQSRNINREVSLASRRFSGLRPGADWVAAWKAVPIAAGQPQRTSCFELGWVFESVPRWGRRMKEVTQLM